MSTYNRAVLLGDAIGRVLAQTDGIAPSFELIVVDNNSTDETRAIVERFAGLDGRVRYVLERKQGLSHARNAGIRTARAALIAFTDDDVRAEPDWVAGIARAFAEHPEADAVGGRVLPLWPGTPPEWLTREHWSPLALVDYGDEVVAITPDRPICLVGANMAFRRRVFDEVGLFAADVQRVKDGIGSVEDAEFQLRLLRHGARGVYDARLVVRAEIQPDRLERAYHRRWHMGHGHFHALLRSEPMEQTSVGTLFGVPAHLYRQALADAVQWTRATAAGDGGRAFFHELRLRFFKGFFRTRSRGFAGRAMAALRARVPRRLVPLRRAAPHRSTRIAGSDPQ